MVRIKDPKQRHLFDPWDFLSPKRRQMLDRDWPGLFRQHILDLLPVEKLALLFPRDFGRPTKEMHTVLGVLVLQQYHDLTDEQAVNQLAYNIQWHYALNIAEESDEAKYICPKTLWTMRLFATELGLDLDIFDETAQKLAEIFKVDISKQRIDSVHIRSNMARLGRIGILTKGIDRFLVNLKRHHPPLWEQVEPELVKRYQEKGAGQCFGGIKPSHSKKVLADVAADLYRLVVQFEDCAEVVDMYSYKQLCRIFKEHCNVGSDGTIEVKAASQIHSDSLQNPSDPDATYSGHKGQGYQVQLMETYSEHEDDRKDPKQLNLITHVEVETACQSDANALLPAIEATLAKDLAPETVQADALYGSDENCQDAKELGVEVISPAMGTEKRDCCSLSDFEFLSNGHIDKCPAGHQPADRKKKKTRYSQGFENELCEACPMASSCPSKKGAKFHYVRYLEKQMRIARRRQYEKTPEFKHRYRWRAGVEATMSQYDRLTGIKHLRVRGEKPVRFSAVMKAIAVNLVRAVAAQNARKRAKDHNLSETAPSKSLLLLFKELLGQFLRSRNRMSRFFDLGQLSGRKFQTSAT